jgi:hypothetical protein
MKGVLRTITIIVLALGLMGIILGISFGLYRNDQLAKLQQAGSLSGSSDQITYPNGSQGVTFLNFLLRTNLQTILLAIGTLLTLISAALFLIGIREMVD